MMVDDPHDQLLDALTSANYDWAYDLLANNEIDVNYASGHFVSVAIASGDIEFLELLVKYGADLNRSSFIASAAEYGYINVVRYLDERGVKLDVDDDYPFIRAFDEEHFDVIQYIVERTPNRQFDPDFVFDHHILEYRNLDVLYYLYEEGFDFTVFGDTFENLIERNKKQSIKKVLTYHG